MGLVEFICLSSNGPYVMTSLIALVLIFIEIIGFFSGIYTFGVIDEALPDFDFDVDIDASSFHPLAWLNFGKVPMLISLLSFLLIFSFLGFSSQWYLYGALGFTLPAYSSVGTFIISLPFVRYLNKGLSRILPHDETQAISTDSFGSELAEVLSPECKADKPAQAKFKDQFGTTHYVAIVPEYKDEVFYQGDIVLLYKRRGHKFSCIRWEDSSSERIVDE